MGDQKKEPEKKIVPAFLEGIAPHMYMDPYSGTRGVEFGFRWNYENPNGGGGGDKPQQPQPQQQIGCCGGGCCGGAGALQQLQHLQGGFGGPRMMLPPPPQRQLGPFMNPNMNMMMAGHHRQHPAARFMGGAPPMGMQMHRRHGGFGPFGPHPQAANYNYFGGYEYEYDYPANYPGGFFRGF